MVEGGLERFTFDVSKNERVDGGVGNGGRGGDFAQGEVVGPEWEFRRFFGGEVRGFEEQTSGIGVLLSQRFLTISRSCGLRSGT